jgi:hypothetical protein
MGIVAEVESGSSTQLPVFAVGQVWRVGERTFEIRRIGKTLIYYRWMKKSVIRPSRELLATPAELTKLVRENHGVLDDR